ncbi:hypothetical protein LSM04_005890 [Trypanosoma melophagium]|uniref:uncharacterized protein n=1 Tax=Trypanosoma melophagium TaxID=715481 RepID=UPI00351A3898|nr:hypothetical protein LSM04_005890 [Trypanosoma melophagium]
MGKVINARALTWSQNVILDFRGNAVAPHCTKSGFEVARSRVWMRFVRKGNPTSGVILSKEFVVMNWTAWPTAEKDCHTLVLRHSSQIRLFVVNVIFTFLRKPIATAEG